MVDASTPIYFHISKDLAANTQQLTDIMSALDTQVVLLPPLPSQPE